MSRKPAHIEGAAAGDRLPGRWGIWAAVRELQTFTRPELRRHLPHVAPCPVDDYLGALVKAGYVGVGPMVDAGSPDGRKVRSYTLVRDVGVDAPRLRKDGTELPETAQMKMWLIMKILNLFTVDDLKEATHTPPATVETYLRHLTQAGYLARLPDGQYRLINNTGGHAPMVQRTKVVYDPNLRRIMWHEDMEP
jgi:hypothetical protein